MEEALQNDRCLNVFEAKIKTRKWRKMCGRSGRTIIRKSCHVDYYTYCVSYYADHVHMSRIISKKTLSRGAMYVARNHCITLLYQGQQQIVSTCLILHPRFVKQCINSC